METKVFKTLKLGGDIGNSFSDFAGENNYSDKFDSSLIELYGADKEKGNNVLELDGRHLVIGQGNLTTATIEDRNLQDYKALAIAGICRYLKSLNINTSKTDVDLHFCIGLPTGDYAAYKESYSKIFEQKEFEAKYEDIIYKFTISKLMIVPQGAVLAKTSPKTFAGCSTAFIIDFGSYTVDVQELNNGELVKGSKKSYEEGVLRDIGALADILKPKGVVVEDEKKIERFIIDGRIRTKYKEEDKKYVTINDSDVQKFFSNKVKNVADKIKRQFKTAEITEKTVIIGGGALAFKDLLAENFNDVLILANADKVNPQAYYYFAGGR